MSRLTVKTACEQLKIQGIKATCQKWGWSADRPLYKGSRIRNPGKYRETWRLEIEMPNGSTRKWLSGYDFIRLSDFVNRVKDEYFQKGGE